MLIAFLLHFNPFSTRRPLAKNIFSFLFHFLGILFPRKLSFKPWELQTFSCLEKNFERPPHRRFEGYESVAKKSRVARNGRFFQKILKKIKKTKSLKLSIISFTSSNDMNWSLNVMFMSLSLSSSLSLIRNFSLYLSQSHYILDVDFDLYALFENMCEELQSDYFDHHHFVIIAIVSSRNIPVSQIWHSSVERGLRWLSTLMSRDRYWDIRKHLCYYDANIPHMGDPGYDPYEFTNTQSNLSCLEFDSTGPSEVQ